MAPEQYFNPRPELTTSQLLFVENILEELKTEEPRLIYIEGISGLGKSTVVGEISRRVERNSNLKEKNCSISRNIQFTI